ncbi:DUF2560 family protein, partial [Escherichia coli]
FELFKDQLVLAAAQPTPVSRVDKAVREAQEALTLFTAGA